MNFYLWSFFQVNIENYFYVKIVKFHLFLFFQADDNIKIAEHGSTYTCKCCVLQSLILPLLDRMEAGKRKPEEETLGNRAHGVFMMLCKVKKVSYSWSSVM